MPSRSEASRPTVLITDAEVRKTLAVVRGLAGHAEVITASPRRLAIAAASRYARRHLRCPAGPELGSWLLEAVRRHRIDALICPQEATLILAGRVYEELVRTGVAVSFPPPATLERALDKAETLRLGARAGLAIPRTVVLESAAEAGAAAADLGYPVVVKPRFSNRWDGAGIVSGSGTCYAATARDLERIMASLDPRLPPPLVQEFVPGAGLGVFVLLDRSGRLCASFAHRRLRDVRPTGSGSVLRESIATDGRLLEASLDLLRRMEWWGVAMVELRTDERHGGAVLMEVNGRFWGSLQLAIDAGVNFPRLLLEVARGGSPEPPAYREGVVLRWWLGDLLRCLRVLKGRPDGFPGDFPSRGEAIRSLLGRQPRGTRHEVFRRDDPWPALAELASIAHRLA